MSSDSPPALLFLHSTPSPPETVLGLTPPLNPQSQVFIVSPLDYFNSPLTSFPSVASLLMNPPSQHLSPNHKSDHALKSPHMNKKKFKLLSLKFKALEHPAPSCLSKVTFLGAF